MQERFPETGAEDQAFEKKVWASPTLDVLPMKDTAAGGVPDVSETEFTFEFTVPS